MKTEDLKKFNADNDAKQAREALQNLKTFGNIPERCQKRLTELFTRRANGGEYTAKDAEFLTALRAASQEGDEEISALCAGSANSAAAEAVAWIFLCLTALAVVAKNAFSEPRRA